MKSIKSLWIALLIAIFLCGTTYADSAIFATGGEKAIWKSEDMGVTWAEVNPEYDDTARQKAIT